jgi:hypothetical protein
MKCDLSEAAQDDELIDQLLSSHMKQVKYYIWDHNIIPFISFVSLRLLLPLRI